MADWNAWKDKAAGLTRMGVGKAKEVGEIARLNLDNVSEEEKIRQAYIEMGERYMQLHGDAPEEPYVAAVQRVITARANIAANKEKIADIKNAGNVSEEDLKQAELDATKKEE